MLITGTPSGWVEANALGAHRTGITLYQDARYVDRF